MDIQMAKTRSPCLNGRTRLLNALHTVSVDLMSWESVLVEGFQLYKAQVGLLPIYHFLWMVTLIDEICLSGRRTASPPKTVGYEVALFTVPIMVL